MERGTVPCSIFPCFMELNMGNKRKILYLLAIAVMLLMFIGSMTLCGIFGVEEMDGVDVFNIGYDMIAMLLSLVLFICCILDGMQNDSDRGTFLLLIFFDLIAMALDGISYCLEGNPALRYFHNIFMAGVFLLDYLLYYLILKYQTMILDIRNERSVMIVLKMFKYITAFLGFFALVNIFTPIYYEIDAMGQYSQAAYYFVNSSYRVVVPLAGFALLLAYRKQIKPFRIAAVVGYDILTIVLVIIEYYVGFYIDYGVILLLLFVFYMILNVENGNKGAVMKRELAIAKRIQAGLLPNVSPDYVDIPEFEIYTQMTPAREVGGDFYDFFMLDDTHFAFLLGDVSVHNVGGSLFMAISKAMLNMASRSEATPADALNDVNKRIKDGNYNNMCAKVWLAFLDISTGHLVYSGAGIPRIAVQDQEVYGVFRYECPPETPALGETAEFVYYNMEADLVPGDRVFIFSDGVISSGQKKGKIYGYDRLLDFLNKNLDKNNEELCHAVQNNIKEFCGEENQHTDVTMLCCTFKQPGKKGAQS